MIRVALLAVAIVALVVVLPNALPAEVHDHADFAVYLHGNLYDFSKEQYMREDREPRIHFHDLNGRIVHVHARGVTLGMLFAGMNMTLTDRCLNLDNGTAYCTDERHRLTLSVNGRINNAFADYVIVDDDSILIVYGDESDETIRGYAAAMPDDACIYSETCPERGSPPPEEGCVGNECALEE